MTSVGIMSMQRIRNYGSTLQAYGLSQLIGEVDPAAKVSFVDFRPGRPLVEGTDPTGGGTLGRNWSKVRGYARIDAPIADRLRFFNHKRRYAASYLPAVGIDAEPNWDSRLDVQVIGSDEVFNCVQANTNVGYSRDLFGHGSSARSLMSYAAAFGNTTLAKLETHGIRDEVADDLSRFASLSVRDRHSQELVEALTGRTASINVDPVLAYDFMRLESRIPTTRQEPADYLIVYAYPGRLSRSENDEIRAYARRRGLRVLAFGGPQACADRFVDCDPFELLGYFRDAAAVVTDTFHGTIFALINQRPFATLIRRSVGAAYGNEEKLGHLLSTFSLDRRIEIGSTSLDEVFEAEIDYDHVERTLGQEREAARSYLRSALSTARGERS